MLPALVRLSEGAQGTGAAHGTVPPELFGIGGFLVLVSLLVIVTRFDPDR